MSTPYDSTARHFFKLHPLEWLNALGVQTDSVEVVNVDMSSIKGEADMVLMIGAQKHEAVNAEIQSGYDAELPERLLLYAMVIRRDRKVPVRSIVVLLRPEADGPAMREPVLKWINSAGVCLEFRFEVVRIWELSAERIFSGGLGVLPLAFIADLKPDELRKLVRRADERINAEAAPGEARDLWGGIEYMLKLRFSKEFIMSLWNNDEVLKTLPSYEMGKEAGIAEGVAQGVAQGEAQGKIEEARAILLRLAKKRFGEPDAAAFATLNAIGSVHELEDLADRMLIVGSWSELLKK